jgi:hypothetical protein
VAALFDVVLFLVFVAVPAAAICTQVIPVRLDNITFHDTDLNHAWDLIGLYAEGTFEQRFGYPTGYFFTDDKRSRKPARLLVREAQPTGAITDGCSMEIGALSLSGFDGGCATGCIGFFMIAIIGAPFILVSVLDRFFRLVLRSRVDVSLVASGPDAVASFAFYGPGGYSLRRRYAQVFEKPALPAVLEMDPVPSIGPVTAADPPSASRPTAPDPRPATKPVTVQRPLPERPPGRRSSGGRHAAGRTT